jgi:hypothetical protein
MSLKAFHIIFIICSSLLIASLGLWSFLAYQAEGKTMLLVSTALSAAALAGMLWYGKYFLRKLKHIDYL